MEKSILLVEKSSVVRQAVVDFLQNLGFHVVACSSVNEASREKYLLPYVLFIVDYDLVAHQDGVFVDVLQELGREVIFLASSEGVSNNRRFTIFEKRGCLPKLKTWLFDHGLITAEA